MGKNVLIGCNDLQSLYPEVAKEFDNSKNGGHIAQDYTHGSNKKIWWKCSKCGHEWLASIEKRTRRGHGCPECRKKEKQINVYDAETLAFLFSFDDAKALCEYLNLDYKKQHGNISMICSRQQKTLMGKYILRHANDDEFSDNSAC